MMFIWLCLSFVYVMIVHARPDIGWLFLPVIPLGMMVCCDMLDEQDKDE